MNSHLWIFCTPEARDAVNDALGKVNPAWVGTMFASLPSGKTPFGPKPEPQMYWVGWQDKPEILQAAMAAIDNIDGVKASFGTARGIDNPSSAETDYTKGDVNTKYTLPAALDGAKDSLSVVLADVAAPTPKEASASPPKTPAPVGVKTK